MLGWLILFASMAAPGAVSAVSGEPATASVIASGLVFSLLFMIGLLTRMARGWAW
jgi:hypothetical protein